MDKALKESADLEISLDKGVGPTNLLDFGIYCPKCKSKNIANHKFISAELSFAQCEECKYKFVYLINTCVRCKETRSFYGN